MPARRTFVLALVVASACAKKAAPDSAAPASESTMPASIDELEAELGRYEAELRGMGFAGDASRVEEIDEGKAGEAPVGEADAAKQSDDDDCARVCDLAAAICGLQDRICGLAADHDGDERYAASCARATDDCDTATEACDACRG